MSKLIILKGLPASGKSTYAKELLEKHGNAVRVNRDLLRTMLHWDKWTGFKEKMTIDAEEELAKYFLSKNKVVIVDDTNLSSKTVDRWTRLGYPAEIIPITTSWQECVERDHKREPSVGKSVIVNMARRYGLYAFTNPEIIVDIDGTLANIEHRRHWVTLSPKNWNQFFADMVNDTVREEVVSQIVFYQHSTGADIMLVSGRPETYRKQTEAWLKEKIGIPYVTLIMRRESDKRPDTEVKLDILNTYFDKSKVVHVFDDRPSVIRMWREQGLEVTDVGDGKEF